ncbi:aldolase [Reyranella sp. CPCC 100927]|uniref:3-oxo-tetronate 4-phosphate decarboxylase n=1 Tax=Reyranella sp. CPCC 100927 TaxID=2599616 RepID=UPI0011B65CF4|nr:aldolase [Reyranella sp. CPCC 100927]TWT15862.1 aldolase [Reyranella sp. CPCC 100927]
MPTENHIRDEICRIGESLHRRGYTVGSAGNISARLADGFLITPTDACLGFLDPASLAKLDHDGRQVAGDRASKTIELHRAVYGARPDVGGIVHTHSTNLVALSMLPDVNREDVLPPITPYFVMKVGHVPMIPYRRPGDPAVVDLVLAHAAAVRAVLLERLGPLVWHDSVSAASFALEELEETAKLWLMLRDVRPPGLSQAQIDDIKHTFKVAY